MPDVRGMLARVRRIEAQRTAPRSPFVLAYGSFEAFAEQVRSEIAAGALDRDFPLPHLERWERDGTWAAAHERWKR